MSWRKRAHQNERETETEHGHSSQEYQELKAKAEVGLIYMSPSQETTRAGDGSAVTSMHSVLAEDLSSNPGIHVRHLTTVCKFQRIQCPLLVSVGNIHTHTNQPPAEKKKGDGNSRCVI